MTNRRGMTWLQAVVRLRPGVPLERLQSAADRTFQMQVSDHPKQYSASQRAVVTPIRDFFTGSSKNQLLLSLIASTLLLISACASAGNLFPSRTLGRRQEIATRTALGATPSQLTAQFVMEALLAGTIAAFAGGELAVVLIRLLTNAAPPDIPRIEHAALNFNVFAVSIGAAMLATFACVMGPIRLLRVRRGDGAIGSGMRLAGSVGGSRLQRLFILAQAALTVLARIPFRRCHGAIR